MRRDSGNNPGDIKTGCEGVDKVHCDVADVVLVESSRKDCSVVRHENLIAKADNSLSNAPLERRLEFRPGKVAVTFTLSNAGNRDSTCVLPLYPTIASSTSEARRPLGRKFGPLAKILPVPPTKSFNVSIPCGLLLG